MSPAETLGLAKTAAPAAIRLAALRELGLLPGSPPAKIRQVYRAKARQLHPDRVAQTDQTRAAWLRLQAAIEVLREPPDELGEREAALWRENLDLAEPFATTFVQAMGENLAGELESRRMPKASGPAGSSPGKPSLVRSIAVDAAQAAVASSTKGIVGKLGEMFARWRNEQP